MNRAINDAASDRRRGDTFVRPVAIASDSAREHTLPPKRRRSIDAVAPSYALERQDRRVLYASRRRAVRIHGIIENYAER